MQGLASWCSPPRGSVTEVQLPGGRLTLLRNPSKSGAPAEV
jgi:hypothetical protein